MPSVGNVGGAASSTDGTKSATITPEINTLVLILTAHTGNTSDALPTDDNADGRGTYSAVQTNLKATSADKMKWFVRNALIGSATSTIFTHAPGTTSGGGLRVIQIRNMPASRVGLDAIRQSAGQDNQAGGVAPAPVLGLAPLTHNVCLSAVFNATNPSAVTVPGSWTGAGTDAGYNSPVTGFRAASRDTGQTSATITWGSTSGTAFCSSAVELNTEPLPRQMGVNFQDPAVMAEVIDWVRDRVTGLWRPRREIWLPT